MIVRRSATESSAVVGEDAVPGFLRALRAATADAHRRLERRLPLVRPDVGLADYLRILQAYHGYFAPLDAALAPHAAGIDQLQWPARRRARRLRRDLLALGMDRASIRALPRCDALPCIDGPAAALGCLYVVEGSTLGGQIISRVLGGRLGIDPERGGAYLAGYGATNGAMWQLFLAAVERFDRAWPDCRPAMIASAEATFGTLERWLETQGVLS